VALASALPGRVEELSHSCGCRARPTPDGVPVELWRLVGRAGGRVTIALCSCDGAEEMARFSSTDTGLLDLVGERRCSED